MEGLFVASAASGQIILSTRFHPKAANLVPLALDALKASKDASVAWFPCPAAARPPAATNYDSDSSDDASDDATQAWAAGASNRIAGACVCCVKHTDLSFALVVSSNIEPTLPFAFLNSLIALLADYLGSVTEATIKDSFDMVYQIFEEIFAAPQPMLTDASALKELIPPPSLYSKVLNAATSALSPAMNPATQAGPEGRHTLSSAIPWRRNGLKYPAQEVYFDVVEEIGGIIDKSGKIIVAEVLGKVEARCRLSGMPDLLMTLSSSDLLQDCCFHPCVRLNKWTSSKTLSFVPPDGQFTLMEYQLAPPTVPGVVPLQVRPVVTIGASGGAFQLTFSSTSAPSRPLENVRVTFELGPHASQVQATLTGGRSINRTHGKDDQEQPGGRWEFLHGPGTLVWQAPKMSAADQPVVLQGTWASSHSPCPSPAAALQASFEAAVTNVSGIQISSLKIASNGAESAKPYKGVRPMLKSGKLEYRWR